MRNTRTAQRRAKALSNIQKRRSNYGRQFVHGGAALAQAKSEVPRGDLNEIPKEYSFNYPCDTVLVS